MKTDSAVASQVTSLAAGSFYVHNSPSPSDTLYVDFDIVLSGSEIMCYSLPYQPKFTNSYTNMQIAFRASDSSLPNNLMVYIPNPGYGSGNWCFGGGDYRSSWNCINPSWGSFGNAGMVPNDKNRCNLFTGENYVFVNAGSYLQTNQICLVNTSPSGRSVGYYVWSVTMDEYGVGEL